LYLRSESERDRKKREKEWQKATEKEKKKMDKEIVNIPKTGLTLTEETRERIEKGISTIYTSRRTHLKISSDSMRNFWFT